MLNSVLDLLGAVVALLGGDVAKGAIKYANVNYNRMFTAFLFVPGLYDICALMLKRSYHWLARTFSPGERQDKRTLIGLKSSGAYKYRGMQSGTKKTAVANVLWEGWERMSDRNAGVALLQEAAIVPGARLGRRTSVGFVRCTGSKPGEELQMHEPGILLMLLLLQAGSAVLLWPLIRTGDAAGIAVCVVNMVVSFCVVNLVLADVYKIPSSNPHASSPSGNALITDAAGERLWVALGLEKDIQNLLQYEIAIEERKGFQKIQVYAALLGTVTAIATILIFPIVGHPAQIWIAGQIGIGLVAEVLLAARDGDAMLLRLVVSYFTMENAAKIQFNTRASAIAAVVFATRGKAEYLGSLVPQGGERWLPFRQMLDTIVSRLPDLVLPEGTSAALWPQTDALFTKQEQEALGNNSFAAAWEILEGLETVRVWEAARGNARPPARNHISGGILGNSKEPSLP
jgi:hypothetical protein